MKRILTNFFCKLIPLSVVVLDAILRHKLYSLWGSEEWFYYTISILFSFLLYSIISRTIVKIYSIKSKVRNEITRNTLLTVLCLIISIVYSTTVLASYGYYISNGILPNYYTLKYLVDYPFNTWTIFLDSFLWYYLFIFAAFVIVCYKALRKNVLNMTSKNEKLRFDMKSELLNLDGRLHITSFGLIYSRRYILNFSLIKKTIQAGLFVLLIFFFNNNVKYYDQCAVGDTNLVALSVRTLTNRIGDFDKGNVGLSSRIPVKLNSYPTPGFNILFIIGESLRSQNMQVYGYHRPTTPFLAELVDSRNNEFFVARRAFTNASTTVVSLPSVFSGIAPYQPSDLLYRTPLFWDYVKSCGYSNFFYFVARSRMVSIE